MKKNEYFSIALVFSFLVNSCAVGTQGGKKMDTELQPVNPIEIKFNDRIVSMFPVTLTNSYGMVAGKTDRETLRIGSFQKNKIKEDIFPRDIIEVSNEIGTCIGDSCREMYLSSRKYLSIVDWSSKKLTLDYLGVGNILKNRYVKTKLINDNKKIAITVFAPYYNDDYSDYINATYCLTKEDIKLKKRIKSIPISTESGEYKVENKSVFGRPPLVSFGPSYVIYRESHEYRWLAVNNDLEYIEHPLKDTLNEYKEYFGTDLVSMEISPDQPYAVAIGQREIGQRHYAAIIQWNKAPAVMPVPLTLQKNEDIEYSSLLLSPSGAWAYFNTNGGAAGSRHFLLYIDPSLPGGCLPPFDLQIPGHDNKATWITKPEGFVMQVGEKMQYWDLSQFDPQKISGE